MEEASKLSKVGHCPEQIHIFYTTIPKIKIHDMNTGCETLCPLDKPPRVRSTSMETAGMSGEHVEERCEV